MEMEAFALNINGSKNLPIIAFGNYTESPPKSPSAGGLLVKGKLPDNSPHNRIRKEVMPNG